MINSEYLTPAEVAKILKVSLKTIIRQFAEYPSVINLGHEEKMHKHRYRVLRIPRSALNQFLAEHRMG